MSHAFESSAVEAALRETAEAHILPLFRNLADGQVRTKSSASDFVTDADVAAEEALTPRLKDLWPGSIVIGEEAAAARPDSVNALLGDGAFWIVDPIDGTRNFVHGSEHFGMMAVLVVDGRTLWSWIYAPIWDLTLVSEAGGGAYLNGERARGRKAGDADAIAGEINRRGVARLLDALSPLEASTPPLSRFHDHGSAAHGYLALARGEADFAVYGKMAPWDHAPGALVAAEIGGRSAFMDTGEAYAPRPWADRALLSVADESAWPRIRDGLLVKD